MHIDRLTEQVENLREQIAMYEAQQSAQGEETIVAKEALCEAKDEIEVNFQLCVFVESHRIFRLSRNT